MASTNGQSHDADAKAHEIYIEQIKLHDNKSRSVLLRIGKEGTPEQLCDFYNKSAEEYHKGAVFSGYSERSCSDIADVIAEIQPKKDARILDCGAGSGYGGIKLYQRGFRNIDYLDPSEGMAQIAKRYNCYKHFIIDSVVPGKRTNVTDSTYDAILMVGAVIDGHISLSSLPELSRMVKKGGTITFNVGDVHLKNDESVVNAVRIEKIFQTYVDDGKGLRWEVKRGGYRVDEECNIYTMFLV